MPILKEHRFSERTVWLVRLLLLILMAATLTACSEQTPETAEEAPDDDAPQEMQVQMASYDLVAGEQSRVLAGLITEQQELVSYGDVKMEFFFAGEDPPQGTVKVTGGPSTSGGFMPIEGSPKREQPGPVVTTASEGRGVYAGIVEFPDPGYWVLQVTAETVDGDVLVGKTQMRVLDEHKVSAVGEKAPASDNLTVESRDAPPQAIDSRAESRADVPDPELHSTTVADVLRRKRPLLVVISTPVYCVSRFCGPVTDMVSDLSKSYDGVEFIHIEVWRNFEEQVLNKAAADWIYRGKDVLEPWIYLVGPDGRIEQRWDNVATRQEIEPHLRRLQQRSAS